MRCVFFAYIRMIVLGATHLGSGPRHGAADAQLARIYLSIPERLFWLVGGWPAVRVSAIR